MARSRRRGDGPNPGPTPVVRLEGPALPRASSGSIRFAAARRRQGLDARILARARLDRRPVVPEDGRPVGVELVPDRPPFLQVDLDADQVVELVGEDDRAGRQTGRADDGEMVALAVDPGTLAPLSIELDFGAVANDRGDGRTEPGLPRRRSVASVSSTTSCKSPAMTTSSSNPARSRIMATAAACSK